MSQRILVTILHCACEIAYLQVTHLAVTGEWSSGSMSALLELAMGGCLQLDTVLRQTLLEDSA